MADRTVSVGLKLLDEQYKRSVAEDAEATKALDRSVKDLDHTIADTAVEMRGMAHETDVAARKTDELGDQMAQTAREAGHLDRQLAEATTAVRLLAAEFDRTGDRDVFAKLRDARDVVANLHLVRKELHVVFDEFEKEQLEAARTSWAKRWTGSITNDMIPAAAKAGILSGEAFGGGFLNTAMQIIKATAPISIPVIIAGTIALSTELGAMASGGLIGVLGIGTIAAGIVAQFSDPRVHAAAADLGADLKREFTSASAGLAEPFIVGLGYLKRDLEPVFADLKKDFEVLRPYVSALLDGFGQMAQKIMPGFNRAIERSGPILEEIGRDLPMLGNAVNILFDEMSKGSKGATEGLHTLLWGLSAIIAGTGFMLRGLSNGFDIVLQGSDAVSGALADLLGFLAKLPGAGAVMNGLAAGAAELHDHLHGLATSFDEGGLQASDFGRTLTMADNSARDLTATLGNMNERFDDFYGKAMNADQAALAFNSALLQLKDSVAKNGHDLRDNTEAGIANRQAILGAVDAAKKQRDAMIESGTSAAYANQVYEDHVQQLRKVLIAAGFTADQIDRLIGKYAQIPGEVGTSILTPGMAKAISDAQSLGWLLNHLDGKVSRSTVITTYYANVANTPGKAYTGGPVPQRWGGVHYAADGLVSFGDAAFYPERGQPTYGIAEPGTGGEAFIPRHGDYNRSLSMVREVAGWLGQTVSPAEPQWTAGGRGGSPGMVDIRVVVQDMSGRVLVEKLVKYAVDTGRSPIELWPAARQ